MSRVIFPGSFDPITLGHLDIIERSCALFDEVFVVIMKNASKSCLFSEEERKLMIEHEVAHLKGVHVVVGSGLTVSLAKDLSACAIVRGIRSVKDYEYEQNIAMVNGELEDDIDTVFLLSQAKYACASSSVVKEIASYHHDKNPFVSEYVKCCLEEKMR